MEIFIAGIISLIIIVIVPVYFLVLDRRVRRIVIATESQNNISRKMLDELRKLNAAEPDKSKAELERPKRPAVELPPKSKASKPTIYEL